MTPRTAGIEIIPSARRLIKSLRDMGYDFAQAVADVVDNSIAAKATHIHIDVEFDGDDSWVRIMDNGTGMEPDVLKEAMRYGAERDYDEDDLGKFGLGLKTASLSQCQRLSVATRWNPDRADVTAYAWDLEHIEATNRWEILPVRKGEHPHGLHKLLREHPGTVVLWERLDRILGYKYPYGEAARTRLAQMCRDLEQHLSMVMHRFLAGEAGRKVRLTVNANEVHPWDPFCRSEAGTERWEPLYLKVEEEGAKGRIRVEPFILPHQSDFSSPGAFKYAAGPNGWNQQQGFYIYRAGRMIQSGGWSRIRAPDEHTKLARISISFLPALDEAFKVNVAKMRAQIPASVRPELEALAQQVAKAARRVYDRREKRLGRSGESSSSTIGGSRATTGAKARLTFDEWRKLTLHAATDGEKPYVRAALARLKSG